MRNVKIEFSCFDGLSSQGWFVQSSHKVTLPISVMEVKLINSISEVKADCWNKLAGSKYPFLRHEFLWALEQSGAVSEHTGWIPQHLLIYSDDQLIALMPLYLKFHSFDDIFQSDW